MKIVQLIGARPQFIKCVPVYKAIHRHEVASGGHIEDVLVHTGQHYDYAMSGIFFAELGIKAPEYHLGVGSGLHGEQTGQILQKTEEVLLKERPDALVVYGDTNSTLGGALAAVKLHIPVVHIEAGLRSYNKYMPEEINRIYTDHSSSLLLCPNESSVNNLRKEGFTRVGNKGKLLPGYFNFFPYAADLSHPVVFNVGDVMCDVLMSAVDTASRKSMIMEELKLVAKEYGIMTLHRAENTENTEKLDEIIRFVNEVSSEREIIFPVHPRTRKVFSDKEKAFAGNIRMIEPLGYFDMAWLLKNSAIALTDSGGLQKEAYWLKVPCITLREETEWVETVQRGWNILYREYRKAHEPLDGGSVYGDGNAAVRIVRTLLNTIGKEKE